MPPRKNKNSQVVKPSRVVAYVRVSTDKQAEQGLSLESQRQGLTRYAEAIGVQLVAVDFDDGASASTLDRPGLQQALGRLESGEADGLIITKLDRLTRSVRDLAELVDEYFKDDYALLSVSENIDTRSAGGRMMLNMLTVIGQWEREAIGERTAAVMQHMKAEGIFTGGFPPYGKRLVDGELVEDPGEQVIVRRARELRAQGHTLRAVACALGTNQRTGKPFAASQIARMM